MKPGTYLQLRRLSAGKSLAQVAAAIATEPRLAEHARAEWLQAIESDTAPARFDTLVVLRRLYLFDFAVLEALVRISLGDDTAPPQLCRRCACSERDPCYDESFGTCWWVESDLCSICADPRTAIAHQPPAAPTPPIDLAA